MKTSHIGLNTRIARFFDSRLCVWFIFILFTVQAVWLAVSAAYPMAFDEQYHFGLIQLHAQQWLPFFKYQPQTGAYGAIVRDPSYLYQWLMSYPYRFMNLFTHDQTIQIVLLRLMNVAMFAYAILVFRRLMRRLGLSVALTNVSLLLFVLIPIVPFLAATINYDNLIMIVVPWSAILAIDVLEAFRIRRVPLARLIVLLSVMLLGCLVKYPFLPVFAVTAVFLFVAAWRYQIFHGAVWLAAWKRVRVIVLWRQVLLGLLLLLSLSLFTERYGINAVQYHTFVPKCDQVISQQQCMQYGPWWRDFGLKQTKPSNFRPDPVTYVEPWLYGMWYRLFFAIGPQPGYDTQPPLFVISLTAIGLAVLLVLGIVLRWRDLFIGHPERLLALLLLIGYGLALFVDDLSEYVSTAQPVAINGRYWIPFLPLLFVLGGIALSRMLRRMPSARIRIAAIAVVVFLLQGGGTMTYIVHSNDSWYWPNTTIRRINGDVRSAVSPLIVHKGYQG